MAATHYNEPIEISIVSPVYQAEALVDELVSRLETVLQAQSKSYEILLVNDGSPDQSWEKIKTICQQKPQVKGINLSRNFGQHQTITAGLSVAKGKWIVVMDCDLQDEPEAIPALLAKAEEGYDVVFAKRNQRQDHFFKRAGSKVFYSVLGYLTDTEQDAEVANFGVYHRKVIDAILTMRDAVKYFPAMVKWVGFKSTAIPVKHAARFAGETSYSFRKLMRLGFDTILSFSDKPLKLMVRVGLVISLISFVFAVFKLVQFLNGEIAVPGYTSLIISIWLLSGLIITVLGIVGLYVGRIFDQVKQRPTFIIDEIRNA